MVHFVPSNSIGAILAENKIACAVYCQDTRVISDGIEAVRNPNDCLNGDVLVPNSEVTFLGTTRTEETKSEDSTS